MVHEIVLFMSLMGATFGGFVVVWPFTIAKRLLVMVAEEAD